MRTEKKNGMLRSGIDLETASLVPLVALGAEILFQVLVMAFGLSDAARTWVIIVGNQIVFFSTCLVFTHIKGISLAELTGVKRFPKPYLFPLFALVAILGVFAFAPLAGLFASLLGKLGYSYVPQYYVPLDDAGLFVLALFGLSVLPAIGEETLMRGVLLSGAKRKSPLFVISFTALVFALFHGNLVQLVHQFLLGAMMAYLVLLTRSIWASAAVHCVNNATALVVEYLFANEMIGSGAYGYFTADFSSGLTAGAFVGVFLGSIVLLLAVLAFITYLMKCARTREGTLPALGVKETVKALLSDPSAEEETPPANASLRFAPLFLVIVLGVMLIANVLSEVL